MIRALAVIALLAAGCGQNTGLPEPPAERVSMTAPSMGGEAGGDPAPFAAFDPGPAQPDSGILWFQFRVPWTDMRGTCEAPEPESAFAADPIWCRAFRERTLDGGIKVGIADSFQVRRGELVTYWRRVPCDTFLCNFRLFKGTVGSCRVWRPQIVQPSSPPAPIMEDR